jgi:signal transduction histidine kinase/CheY-like chemotaxis protein
MTSHHTILIVDDSLTQLMVLQDVLSSSGYLVETAQNGLQAISMVYTSPPDLILSDILMPELNGYHLCRILKNDPLTKKIPVILLSNLSEPHDRFWGEKAGADYFLEKTGDLSRIVDTIRQFLADPPKEIKKTHPPLQEPDSNHIRDQITDILDRLLYESTISNEILKLTSLAHDTNLLTQEFLGFLSIICRYSAAGLLLRTGAEKYLIVLQLKETMPDGFIEYAKKEILIRNHLENDQRNNYHFVLIDQGMQNNFSPSAQNKVIKSLPICDGNQLLASIILFESGKRGLTDSMRHALDIIADRFLIVARYLKKIREIENVKSDLVSMLVHDMRSPLTGISGFTDVLTEGILGQISPEQKDALSHIQKGCDQLLELIDDILDYSKLEAGKMQVKLAPLDIAPLVHQIISPLATIFKEKSLEIIIDIPENTPQILADDKQLTRVFSNLISNATKFTPSGGRITISTIPPKCDAKNLRINITDTGCGIPHDQQKILFDRYEQLPSATVYRKGTGLGLAICKEIINLHSGKIWVESPAGEAGGSRFSFTLLTTVPPQT